MRIMARLRQPRQVKDDVYVRVQAGKRGMKLPRDELREIWVHDIMMRAPDGLTVRSWMHAIHKGAATFRSYGGLPINPYTTLPFTDIDEKHIFARRSFEYWMRHEGAKTVAQMIDTNEEAERVRRQEQIEEDERVALQSALYQLQIDEFFEIWPEMKNEDMLASNACMMMLGTLDFDHLLNSPHRIIYTQNKDGMTLLQFAVSQNMIDTVELLLSAGSVASNAIRIAADNENWEMVRALLGHGGRFGPNTTSHFDRVLQISNELLGGELLEVAERRLREKSLELIPIDPRIAIALRNDKAAFVWRRSGEPLPEDTIRQWVYYRGSATLERLSVA